MKSLPLSQIVFPFHFIFIYLGFYVAFNTVQVISRQVVGRSEETSTYSSLGLCTVNCRPTASNYQLSHLRPSPGSNPSLRGGRRECYHSTTVAPFHFIPKFLSCYTTRLLAQQHLTYYYTIGKEKLHCIKKRLDQNGIHFERFFNRRIISKNNF